MEYNDELTHWGIKGMRWGVRRYQNPDGTLTKAGQKRYNSEMAKIKAETQKIKNQQRTAAKLSKLEAAKKNLDDLKKGKDKTKDTEETDEQKRDRILQKPTAKEVYENRHLFSNKEVGDLYLRLNNEENIKRLVPKEVDPKKARADQFIEKVGDLTTKALTIGKAYNFAATVYNAFNGADGASLPKLDLDNVNKGNKEQRKQEKKKTDNKSDNKSGNSQSDNKSGNKSGNNQSNNQSGNKSTNNQSNNQSGNKSDDSWSSNNQSKTNKSGNNSKTTGTGVRGEKWVKKSQVVDAEYYEVVSNDNNTSAGRSYVSGYLKSAGSTLALPAPKDDD